MLICLCLALLLRIVILHVSDIPKWKQDYFNSCNKFIIAETLSPTFVGMTFSKVAEICYVKLNLLLLAIEATYSGVPKLVM